MPADTQADNSHRPGFPTGDRLFIPDLCAPYPVLLMVLLTELLVLAYVLASRGIITMEDLAEQGVDELMDIPDMTEERAGELIMTARAPWFAEAEE